MRSIIFDIETGPLPEEQILELYKPLVAEDVKLGNLKDPEKITAKIAEAQATHRAEFIAGAALSAVTGRVLAIGYAEGHSEKPPEIHCVEQEIPMLQRFWETWRQNRASRFVGFNIASFDLPFLFRRSWALGLEPANDVRSGRFWHSNVIDLREVWQLGDRQAHGSLDVVARFFGVGRKNGDGARFAQTLKADREAALAYARNDVEMTRAVYRRMRLGAAM